VNFFGLGSSDRVAFSRLLRNTDGEGEGDEDTDDALEVLCTSRWTAFERRAILGRTSSITSSLRARARVKAASAL